MFFFKLSKYRVNPWTLTLADKIKCCGTLSVFPQACATVQRSTESCFSSPAGFSIFPVPELCLFLSHMRTVCQGPAPGAGGIQTCPNLFGCHHFCQVVKVLHVVYGGQVSVLLSAVSLGFSPVLWFVNEVVLTTKA